MPRTALIIGVTGQDGPYLARFLLSLDYRVHGTTRDVLTARTDNLETLGVLEKTTLHSYSMSDVKSTIEIIEKTAPDEIYILAGEVVCFAVFFATHRDDHKRLARNAQFVGGGPHNVVRHQDL